MIVLEQKPLSLFLILTLDSLKAVSRFLAVKCQNLKQKCDKWGLHMKERGLYVPGL